MALMVTALMKTRSQGFPEPLENIEASFNLKKYNFFRCKWNLLTIAQMELKMTMTL